MSRIGAKIPSEAKRKRETLIWLQPKACIGKKYMEVSGKKETIQTKKGNYYLYLQDRLTGMSDS